MASVHGSSSDQNSTDKQSVGAELCRMFWMAFGPVGILFSAAGISKQPSWTYTILDAVYWGLVVLAVVTKFVHVRVFHGMNTENRPSTMADGWAYLLKLGGIAIGLWLTAQWVKM